MEINGLIDEINFQHYLSFITTRMCATLKFNSNVTSFLFYGSRIILIQLLALFSIPNEMSQISYHNKHNNICMVSI